MAVCTLADPDATSTRENLLKLGAALERQHPSQGP